jgi:hypothetical protein
MKLKLKSTILILMIGLMMLAGFAYSVKGSSSTERAVTIVDYGFNICTYDIPTSDCGSYDVTAQTGDGRKTTYKVAGFSNRDSKLYDEISSKITKAKEQKKQVTLKVNDKGEIISVQ